METKKPDGDGENAKMAGYGKPPEHTKWKKGVSGNPKGRPKGARNLRTVVQNTAHSRVAITINGTKKNLSGVEAQVETTKLRGLQGKPQSEARMLDLYRTYLPDDDEVGTPPLTQEELSILNNYGALKALIDEALAVQETPEQPPPSSASPAPKKAKP